MFEGQSILSFKEIQSILPHRYPFLLIDCVLSLHRNEAGQSRKGHSIVALKSVTINEPYFQGHFPHRPVMPGVIIVEVMGQAGAICAYREEDGTRDMALASVKRAKFRAPIEPGDQMEVHVTCTKDRGDILAFSGQVMVRGQLKAEAEFIAKAFEKLP